MKPKNLRERTRFDRRWKLVRAVLGFCIALLSLAVVAKARPPNVLLIMTDDQGYGDLGCHGNTMLRTPNLDRLHKESARLTNFHVDPTCSPTRAALLTGRYSTRTGVWHTVMGRSLLFHDEVTLADLLGRAGYSTAIFGKWHLGDNFPMRPQDRGFQEVLIHGGGGVQQTPDAWGNDYFDDIYLHNGRPETFRGYCTEVWFNQALAYIEQRKTEVQPFFVYLSTNAPHGPFLVEDSYSRPYREKGVPAAMASFYGMIENFDENIGRLLGKLREWQLDENTIVIFMTDNGTAAGAVGAGKADSGAWRGFNAGMRGIKGSPYEGGHRVPCFVRWPAGGLGGGRDIGQLAAHFDLLPTLLELCGVTKPDGLKLDGRSLVPLLRGTDANWPDSTLFVHTQREEIPPKWRASAVLTTRWRLIHGAQLFDIAVDPGQNRDVAQEHREVVAQLREAYEEWWTSLTPAFERHARIVIGAAQENPSQITCMDWHAASLKEIPWNQPLIREAPWANGFWMIEVARAGTYEFTLRQQPAAAKFPIAATHARLRIGDNESRAPIDSGSSEVTLKGALPAGPARLQTWLTEEASGKSRGAFFIEARRLDVPP